MAAKVYLHKAVASGSGHFPMDMLRYESCWPADSDSVVEMVADDDPEANPVREVHLRKYSWTKLPTSAWHAERWRSFGWKLEVEACNEA